MLEENGEDKMVRESDSWKVLETIGEKRTRSIIFYVEEQVVLAII